MRIETDKILLELLLWFYILTGLFLTIHLTSLAHASAIAVIMLLLDAVAYDK